MCSGSRRRGRRIGVGEGRQAEKIHGRKLQERTPARVIPSAVLVMSQQPAAGIPVFFSLFLLSHKKPGMQVMRVKSSQSNSEWAGCCFLYSFLLFCCLCSCDGGQDFTSSSQRFCGYFPLQGTAWPRAPRQTGSRVLLNSVQLRGSDGFARQTTAWLAGCPLAAHVRTGGSQHRQSAAPLNVTACSTPLDLS